MTADATWTVSGDEARAALAGFVRARTGAPWSEVKRWIATGKVFVDGEPAGHPGLRLAPGAEVSLRMTAPARSRAAAADLVHDDAHVVVIDKPAGISSVPYEPGERDTAMDRVRAAWRRSRRTRASHPLLVVHRIDKATSGLLVFAKSKRAERGLAAQFRAHTVDRSYLCVAHGHVEPARIESRLVADRGDRLRGSTRDSGRGKRAVTHVRPVEELGGATLCEVRLETGKTHQIRIHLSERGHPLVGDRVYTRDFIRDGRPILESPRLLLHAHTLGFEHPVTGEALSFESPLPDDFRAVLDRLARRR